MKSIIFKKPGVYAYEDRPVPQIKNPDDVQIKVLGVGICGTDLHVLMDPPSIPRSLTLSSATSTAARWWLSALPSSP